jgi:hypothetical protein
LYVRCAYLLQASRAMRREAPGASVYCVASREASACSAAGADVVDGVAQLPSRWQQRAVAPWLSVRCSTGSAAAAAAVRLLCELLLCLQVYRQHRMKRCLLEALCSVCVCVLAVTLASHTQACQKICHSGPP